jgi:hypothetical protein
MLHSKNTTGAEVCVLEVLNPDEPGQDIRVCQEYSCHHITYLVLVAHLLMTAILATILHHFAGFYSFSTAILRTILQFHTSILRTTFFCTKVYLFLISNNF